MQSKKKGGDLVVAKIRASHSLAKTGGVLLVHVLRQVKPYIYIYMLLYPGTPSVQILSISCGIMPLWRLGEFILLSSYSGVAGVRVRESRNEGDQPCNATKQVLFYYIPYPDRDYSAMWPHRTVPRITNYTLLWTFELASV